MSIKLSNCVSGAGYLFTDFCRLRFAKGESWRSKKRHKRCRLRCNSCMKLVEGDYQNSFAKFARLTVWCNTAQEICGSKRHMQSMDELLKPRPLPEYECKQTIMQSHQGCETLLSVGVGELHLNKIYFICVLHKAENLTCILSCWISQSAKHGDVSSKQAESHISSILLDRHTLFFLSLLWLYW